MNKKIIILNGYREVGKDLFVEIVKSLLSNGTESVWHYSSIDFVKEVAKFARRCADEEVKATTKDRDFLHMLKLLLSQYYDIPMEKCREKVEEFKKDKKAELLFIDIIEPDAIKRAKEEFGALTLYIESPQTTAYEITELARTSITEIKYDLYVISDKENPDDYIYQAETFIKRISKI